VEPWWKRPWPVACLLGIALALASILLRPCFVVLVDGDRLVTQEVQAELPFSIHFIHSVQKTPVLENLQVERDGTITLLSTQYQSFGVGLPFLESEGDFHMEGTSYVFDHMDRHFRTLTLRTGVGTQLTLTVGERTIPLYQYYPPGTRIDLMTVPAWRLVHLRPLGK